LKVFIHGVGMSTIFTLSAQSPGYAIAHEVGTPTVSGSFSQTMADISALRSWVTKPESSEIHRPSVQAFMEHTGLSFLDASELIHGVLGSNVDVRDWSVIMASDDPIGAVREATSQLYGRTDLIPRADAVYVGASDTLAMAGNFGLRLLKDEKGDILDQGLKLIDAQGFLLRDAGSSPESISRNNWLFGVDISPLQELAAEASPYWPHLGKAIQQATRTVLAPNISAPNVPADHKVRLFSMFDKAGTTEPPTQKNLTESVSRERFNVGSDTQETTPSLEQTTRIASEQALTNVDSATYLQVFFKSSVKASTAR
jgi:hypothetical protein